LEPRDRQRAKSLDRQAREPAPREGGQADPEQRQRESRRHLIGLQRDGQEGEYQREQHRGAGRGREAGGQAPRTHPDGEGGEGADQHHPLDAKVQYAGTFRHQLAERRIDERRRGDHAPGDDGGEEFRVHAGRGLTQRTRKWTNRSAASR
jgi:hypothetical protein